jgi:hypothetical protein
MPVSLAFALLLGACSGFKAAAPDAESTKAELPPAVAESPQPAVSAPVAAAPISPPVPPPPPEPVMRVLSYAERVRGMSANELSQEAARLNGPPENATPVNQVLLSLVLSQTRQLPELIRAQELLSRVLANGNADAQPLHSLARLLAFRYSEQRRLEDQVEKERQQTREVQRKLDQTTERLEALKAIERSLTTRPPAPAASAPAGPPAAVPPASTPNAPQRRRSSAL